MGSGDKERKKITEVAIIRWMNKENTHVVGYYSAMIENAVLSIICSRMVGTRGHDVEWNKPDTERRTVHVLPYM